MTAKTRTHDTVSLTAEPIVPRRDAGKRALVVGASSGMGAELVRQLAREGLRGGGDQRDARPGDALAAEPTAGEVHAFAHDVNAIDEIPALLERVVEALGGLDLYVYAAGVMPDGVGPEGVRHGEGPA